MQPETIILALAYPILIWIIGVTLAMLLLWIVIRSAVKRALWDHYMRVGADSHRVNPAWND